VKKLFTAEYAENAEKNNSGFTARWGRAAPEMLARAGSCDCHDFLQGNSSAISAYSVVEGF
jgi:formate-dependent nitrite reductase cytochrome c552 subunit